LPAVAPAAPAAASTHFQVTIGATLQLFGHTFKIPLTIQKLQFHVLARISAQPMMAHYPYLGSVGVSLLEPPHVDFELPVGGVDVMALPMLRGVVRMATQLAARQFAVFPR
jgi:Ca2+-dependent lipid-binding protein